MAKSKGGIETGSFQTSGVNDEMKDTEPKARGGDGSAKMSKTAPHMFAHKQPCCE
jgi:hypothetical protein